MEEKKIELKLSTRTLKTAFRHFYDKTKEYYTKRNSLHPKGLDYLSICEYLSGHLSNKGGVMDLDWYKNERDLGGYNDEVLGIIYSYCAKMAENGFHFIQEGRSYFAIIICLNISSFIKK